MPLTPGAPVGKTIDEFRTGKTYAHTLSKFGKKRATNQAIAVALSNARKAPERAMGGATGVAPMLMSGGPIGVGMPSPALPNRAAGGGMAMAGFSEKAEARSLMHGPIISSVPGRTDAHKAAVPSGSYVVPADIVSGRGQGNTLAGMNTLQRLFHMGPYGSSPGMIRPGRSPGFPKAPGFPKPAKMAHSGGGKGGDHVGHPVPVNLAGGELVIPPEKLMEVVHPNLKNAHAIMDSWVLQERKKLRKTLGRLPPPAKD